MLPFKLVYHPGYDLNLGAHVFPSQKYRLIRERLIAENLAGLADFVEPLPAADREVLLVHDAGWVARLQECRLTIAELVKLEIPWNPATRNAVWLACGGSILAARNALRDAVGFNIGGGFHHAFRAHGEGFCALNDIAIAIRVLRSEGLVERAAVIDCDVHHGNGTASIFSGDPTVATLSIHQYDNYPTEKPESTVDVHLPDRVGDAEYLGLLAPAMEKVFDLAPGLMFYVAGADPYISDQLGGLALTIDGLRRRDRLVFEAARARGIPVAVVLAGGYAYNTGDTVTIHCNTVKAALECAQAVR